MSHTTTIRSVPIRSISAVRTAVQELQNKGVKCELIENAQPRMYYAQQHGVCPYVLKLQDSRYDVGFSPNATGAYDIVMDTWAGEIERQIGDNRVGDENRAIAKFLRAYTKAATIEAAQEQGYMIEAVTEHPDGTMTISVDCE